MKKVCIWILLLTILLLFFIIPMSQAGEKPILIGGTVSLEGKYVETSAMIQKGYKLWAEQINKQGGILGRPVKLILYNDKSQKNLVASLYEKLIVEDKVDLTLSPYGTPLTMAASEVTEKYGYVMLACAAAGEKIWERGYKYIFGVYALADRYFIGFQDLLARKGFESIGIIFENSGFNISIAKGVRRWAERFNLKIAYDSGFDDGNLELPIILKQVMKKNVDGLIFSGYPPECYKFISLMKKADYRPKALTFTIAPTHPDFNKNMGPFAEGIFAPSQWEPDERIPFPGTKLFIKDFNNFSGVMPSYHAASAYSACQILEKAIIQAQAIDHQKIRNYVSSFDTVTIMGRFKVDHTGRQVGHNPILIQWQNGKKEIVYPGKMSTSSPLFKTGGE